MIKKLAHNSIAAVNNYIFVKNMRQLKSNTRDINMSYKLEIIAR